MSDNGKTPEQIKAEKFSDNPDNFIDIADLVLAVRRREDKIETLVNSSNRVEIESSLMRITHYCFGIFNAMSFASQQPEKKIIQPKGGMLNFVRGKRI